MKRKYRKTACMKMKLTYLILLLQQILYEGQVYGQASSRCRDVLGTAKLEGGPAACDDHLKANYKFEENETPSIVLTFCGIPKPTVEWNFNSMDINTAASSQQYSTVPYCFKYDVTLPRLTQNVCGKTLTYSVSGYSGNNVLQGGSNIFINFQPSVIENIVFFEESDRCNSVTWTALDVGDCSVTYTVEYLNSRGASILTVTGITSQQDCNPQSKNASSVRVWAVSGDKIGVIGSAVALSQATTTTARTMMTSRIIASVGKIKSGNVVENFGVIVFIVSGILVVIIVTVFIIVFYKAKLKKDNKRCVDRSGKAELTRSPKYYNERYSAIKKKSSNRENPNQSGYTELNPETREILPNVYPDISNYEVVLIGEALM